LSDLPQHVIRHAIAGNPDGHLSPWQEAVGHKILLDEQRNGCANDAPTTAYSAVMHFRDIVAGKNVDLNAIHARAQWRRRNIGWR